MLLAYHSKEDLKAQTIAAMEADITAERLVGGHYWDGKTDALSAALYAATSIASLRMYWAYRAYWPD
jgi:hypothetical protein